MDDAITVSNTAFFQMVEDFLLEDKSILIRVKGNSMWPFLREGDCVELNRTEKRTLKIGEVVLAKWQGRYVLHRIIFKGSKYYYLSGDNNLFQVERVKYESVIARVINCHREGKSIKVKGISLHGKAILWFLLRPLRWINVKIEKNNRKYHETTR